MPIVSLVVVALNRYASIAEKDAKGKEGSFVVS